MESKNMSRIKFLLFLFALAVQAPLASATVTYAVGTCEPRLASFETIQSALGAAPLPNVVKICPGTYPEQLAITFPVTLEGISAGNATGATISVPASGLSVNVTNAVYGNAAAQVLVQTAAGEVNLSNLTLNGTGNKVGTNASVVGVYYANSSGTMDHLTLQNQNGNELGVGVWIEGDGANPSVTLENSNLQGFDYSGAIAETNSSSSGLSATIKENYFTASFPTYPVQGAIGIGSGVNASVSGNLTSPGFTVGVGGGNEGSISKNTITGANTGIWTHGASVTSNTIYNSGTIDTDPPSAAIWVGSSVASVTGNIITQFGSYGNAIDYDCVAGSNVHSNTIQGAPTALLNVPPGTVTPNTFYNVSTYSGTQTVGECQ
jgi:hypothetical protein